MADEDTKYKHSQRRKRNLVKRDMFSNERKGAYAIKVQNPRKPEYERVRLRPNVIQIEVEDEFDPAWDITDND